MLTSQEIGFPPELQQSKFHWNVFKRVGSIQKSTEWSKNSTYYEPLQSKLIKHACIIMEHTKMQDCRANIYIIQQYDKTNDNGKKKCHVLMTKS